MNLNNKSYALAMVYDQNEWNPSIVTNFREGWNWQIKKIYMEKRLKLVILCQGGYIEK